MPTLVNSIVYFQNINYTYTTLPAQNLNDPNGFVVSQIVSSGIINVTYDPSNITGIIAPTNGQPSMMFIGAARLLLKLKVEYLGAGEDTEPGYERH